MKSIEILGNGIYLPKQIIDNDYFNSKFNLDENWIYKRTGIKARYWENELDITQMAVEAVKDAITKTNIDIQQIDCIIACSTSTDKIMPGVSFEIQKEFDIKKCMCIDLLAGCSGYINAFDIARKYICLEEINCALIVGVEKVSEFLNYEDINTSIILGDGAGATILKSTDKYKLYSQHIESIGQDGHYLTCSYNNKLYMDGKNIYKFGVTKTVDNIKALLNKNNLSIEDIKYIIPHQSNIRILEAMCKNLNISKDKMYINLENIGNTFCASIPIALSEMTDKGLLQPKDKIIMIGYGGGLNLGSVLLEI